MMKKITLFVVCFLGMAVMLQAQLLTNVTELKRAAAAYKTAGEQNYARALALSKSRGWPLRINLKQGRIGVLVGVDALGFPKYYTTTDNIIAAATTGANQLWPGGSSGLNLSGSTAYMKNKIGIWDGGSVLSTHVELVGRVTQKDTPTSVIDHATHVSGTMIATGVNPVAKGMAFAAPGLIAYDFNNDIAEIASEAPNLLLSNHSYSIIAGWDYNTSTGNWEFNGLPGATEDYKFGYYSTDSQSLDSIAYNAPYYLIVKSAGNNRDENGPAVGQPYYRFNSSGVMAAAGNRPAGISSNDSYDIISWDCGAKNILTVGAVSGIPGGYTKAQDVVMSSFSSWGPTDDGRIKPDVVADGVNVLSCVAESNTSYATYSGTSMSSPNTCGSLFLLQEYYSKLKNGAFLRSATLKGLAIHTADEAGTTPGPDYQFGWGLLDVLKASQVITAAVPSNNAATSSHLLYENTLTSGQPFSITVVASGNGPLKATISWTDIAGSVDLVNILNNRTKKLVNDLDVRVTTGSGTTLKTYYPWTLDVLNPSFAAVPGDNITDNVERIDIDSAVPGQTYTITVSNKGTLARGSQAYSLLVSGVGGNAFCTSSSGGGGARIDSVGFSNISVVNSAGSKTYTNNTKYIANIQAAQTIPLSVKVSTADASTNSRIVKVYIDYNNNGVFDSAELVATSGVLSSAPQVFTTSITTPGSLTIGNTSLMRIIVEETANAASITPCGTYGRGETQDYLVQVVSPSTDMAISQIESPLAGDCPSAAAFLTVTIRNYGAVDQPNVPLTASVVSGGSTIASFSTTYPGTIPAQTSMDYTFQTPFVTAGSTSYTLSASVNITGDQNTANNQLANTITTAAKATAPVAKGELCNTTAYLSVSNPTTANYFWYTSATGAAPFATGSSVNTNNIPSNNTFYVGKEAKTSIGPVNKLVYTQGGYNTFNGNYVTINNSIPITIESARLYIGNPGQILVTLADLISVNASTGSYSYSPLASTLLNVYATTPTPTPGSVVANSPSDTGAVYFLNLPVSTTGDHILIVQCMQGLGRSDSASIFRNNSIPSSNTYPISLPGIMSITGNSASSNTATASNYYYFFYDMRINTGACISDRVPVVASAATVPVIVQQGDSLISSIATGNQWYLNDTIISGATNNHYTPTKAGRYKVIVTDSFSCQQTSNAIVFVVTAIANVQAQEIKLTVSPNPNSGVFNLSFQVTAVSDLTINIMDASGRKVYTSSLPNFTGTYSKQISLPNLSSEMYIVNILHNNKSYTEKVVIQR